MNDDAIGSDFITERGDPRDRIANQREYTGINSSSYEVAVIVGTLKVEHVGETLRRLQAAAESLHEDGLDV